MILNEEQRLYSPLIRGWLHFHSESNLIQRLQFGWPNVLCFSLVPELFGKDLKLRTLPVVPFASTQSFRKALGLHCRVDLVFLLFPPILSQHHRGWKRADLLVWSLLSPVLPLYITPSGGWGRSYWTPQVLIGLLFGLGQLTNVCVSHLQSGKCDIYCVGLLWRLSKWQVLAQGLEHVKHWVNMSW